MNSGHCRCFSPDPRPPRDRICPGWIFSGPASPSAFTLIELMVVIFLLSLMLVITFPRLSGLFSQNDQKTISRWLISRTIQLKNKAVATQQPQRLQVDLTANLFRAGPVAGGASAALPEKTATLPRSPDQTLQLSDDLEIVAVIYADGVTVSRGTTDIIMYPEGYCDRAMLHLNSAGGRFSIYIAPFLTRVKVLPGHVDLSTPEWS